MQECGSQKKKKEKKRKRSVVQVRPGGKRLRINNATIDDEKSDGRYHGL
jgi:hypothetical protein